jgi:carbon starvation protein
LLASIALCLATTVILKMHLKEGGRPAFALVTLVPLAWLLVVTITAGVQKIASPDPRVGFFALADSLEKKLPALEQAVAAARASGSAETLSAAEKALRNNQVLIFNQYLDAAVAGAFLVLVVAVVAICIWQWLRLLARRIEPILHENAAVWLPDYAVKEGRPANFLGTAALFLGLLKELSGEAEVERAAKQDAMACCDEHQRASAKVYTASLDERYKSIRRCC